MQTSAASSAGHNQVDPLTGRALIPNTSSWTVLQVSLRVVSPLLLPRNTTQFSPYSKFSMRLCTNMDVFISLGGSVDTVYLQFSRSDVRTYPVMRLDAVHGPERALNPAYYHGLAIFLLG